MPVPARKGACTLPSRAPLPQVSEHRAPLLPSPQLLHRHPHLGLRTRSGTAGSHAHTPAVPKFAVPCTPRGQPHAGNLCKVKLDVQKAAEDGGRGWGTLTWERVASSIFPAGLSLRPARGHPGWRCPEHAARAEFAVERRTDYGRGDRAAPPATRNFARPRATRPHPGLATCGPCLAGRRGSARRVRAACFGRRVGVPGLPPTAQGRGGAVRPGSRGRLELGPNAPLSSGYPARSSPAVPASRASGTELLEALAEPAELALLCCWKGAGSPRLLQNIGCPVHSGTDHPSLLTLGGGDGHSAHYTLHVSPILLAGAFQ